jgi:hypothetical protein
MKLFWLSSISLFVLTACQIASPPPPGSVSVTDSLNPNSATPTAEIQPTPAIIPDFEPPPLPSEPEVPTTPPVTPPTTTPTTTATSSPPAVVAAVNYAVPFTSQAPYGIWDALHGEACEEASMIMVSAYFNQQSLTQHGSEQAILNLVNWQTSNDYAVDLTAEETKEVLADYFDIEAELVYQVTVDRIKTELNKGALVIVPAAGRQLGNPYFTPPGPIYHMLVIRGYNETQFITNDPGTRRGQGYVYEYQTLLNAVHNWNHQRAEGGMTDSEMAQGEKVMLVIYP